VGVRTENVPEYSDLCEAVFDSIWSNKSGGNQGRGAIQESGAAEMGEHSRKQDCHKRENKDSTKSGKKPGWLTRGAVKDVHLLRGGLATFLPPLIPSTVQPPGMTRGQALYDANIPAPWEREVGEREGGGKG